MRELEFERQFIKSIEICVGADEMHLIKNHTDKYFENNKRIAHDSGRYDYEGHIGGIYVAIEFKVHPNKRSPAQVKYGTRLNITGGCGYVVTLMPDYSVRIESPDKTIVIPVAPNLPGQLKLWELDEFIKLIKRENKEFH